jgi:hypothetical protein
MTRPWLRLVSVNPDPARTGKRAGLRVAGCVQPRKLSRNHSELFLAVMACQERIRKERAG